MRYALSSFLLDNFPILNEAIFGYPAWYWASVVLALLISFALARVLGRPLGSMVAFLSKQRDVVNKRLFIEKLYGPIQVFATLVIFLLLSRHCRSQLRTAFGLCTSGSGGSGRRL